MPPGSRLLEVSGPACWTRRPSPTCCEPQWTRTLGTGTAQRHWRCSSPQGRESLPDKLRASGSKRCPHRSAVPYMRRDDYVVVTNATADWSKAPSPGRLNRVQQSWRWPRAEPWPPAVCGDRLWGLSGNKPLDRRHARVKINLVRFYPGGPL